MSMTKCDICGMEWKFHGQDCSAAGRWSGLKPICRINVLVYGDDRLACSNHLRKIADMIMKEDAPGWTSSDVNGNAWADKVPPGDLA